MKRSIITSVATVAAIAVPLVAQAADMPVKAPYYKAPPPPAVYNWSGCYLGGYGGGAWDSRDVRTADPTSTGGTFAAGTFYNAPFANAANGGAYSYKLNSGGMGGGTLGCNWQAQGSSWVWGVEADGGYMRLHRDVIDPFSVSLGNDTRDSTKIGDWDGTVAARFGWANDRVLFYVKGGGGATQVRVSTIDACTTAPCGTGLLAANASSTRGFWMAGGGIEWAWTNAWSVKAEYMYLGLNSDITDCGPGAATAAGSTFCSAHRLGGVNTVKIGLNYHWGPMAAR